MSIDLGVFQFKTYLLIVVAYTFFGIAAHELFRRYIKSSLLFFGASLIALTSIWIKGSEQIDWFFWAKGWLITALACVVLLARANEKKSSRLLSYVLYYLVIANIVEAGIRLICAGSVANVLNVFSALILIATLAPPRTIVFENVGVRDLLWDLPYAWIFSYTAWQMTFFYSLFPEVIMMQFIILLPPLLIALKNRKLYAQARICTLSVFFIAGLIVPFFRNQQMTPQIQNETVSIFASAALLIFLIFNFFRSRRSGSEKY